jgi:prepilin-type N-terminal cleavage/methylation domain-containing protein
MMLRKQKGFTIVELLIVIVVIAILAAVTIVSFNGIQQRARLTQVQTGIGQYVKALMQYAVENNAYPIGANTSSMACFDGVPDCFTGSAPSAPASAALSAAMKKYLPQDPVLPPTTADSILMQWASTPKFYIYFLQDGANSECVTVSGTILWNNAPAGTGDKRLCRLLLPDPA